MTSLGSLRDVHGFWKNKVVYNLHIDIVESTVDSILSVYIYIHIYIYYHYCNILSFLILLYYH